MTRFNVLEGSAPYVDVTTLTPIPPLAAQPLKKPLT